ncbi:MAG: hypothetical protein JRH20_27710, partial [Deltaproteobacteria bacterium]|nr:hypothetical protein [Deltaproteobacteria bacterium]
MIIREGTRQYADDLVEASKTRVLYGQGRGGAFGNIAAAAVAMGVMALWSSDPIAHLP